MASKLYLFCIVVALSCLQCYGECPLAPMNWCINKTVSVRNSAAVHCPVSQMLAAYKLTKRITCPNCEKYIRCHGNYMAVNRCQGWRTNIEIAVLLSKCWQRVCPVPSHQKYAFAEIYGRSGGNCDAKYLCKEHCKYSPRDLRCRNDRC